MEKLFFLIFEFRSFLELAFCFFRAWLDGWQRGSAQVFLGQAPVPTACLQCPVAWPGGLAALCPAAC